VPPFVPTPSQGGVVLPPNLEEVLQTLPGSTIKLPPAQGGDILDQAGIPVLVPGVELPETPPVIELPEEVITPTQEQAQQPTVLHDDTAAVLGQMLAIEATSKWKRVEESLKPWQQERALKVDGKFGPKSATTMALETGLLPIVRYWPAGATKDAAVKAYRETLRSIAVTAEEPRRTQLLAAAEREKGQGFGTSQKPISPLISFG
jgi:hypothetical protein